VIEIEDDKTTKSAAITDSRFRKKREVVTWLENWKQKRVAESRSSRGSSKKSKKYSECSEDEEFSVADTISDFDDSDKDSGSENDKEIQNVFILLGKTGTGKSSLVYEVAKEVGAAVIEINTSQARSSSALKKLVSEAGQSRNLHGVCDNMTSGCISIDVDPEEKVDCRSKFSIILFDEVDVCFEDEDAGFYSSIIKLANSSRNPIILTAEKLPDSLVNLSAQVSYLYRCSPEEFTSVYKNQFTHIPDILFHDLCMCASGDLRAASSDLSLFSFRSEVNLPSVPCFSQWLFDRAVNISVFDAISFPTVSCPSVDNHSIDLFPPVIHSLFPRMIVRNRVTEITIDGANFLQSLSGKLQNRRDGDLPLLAQLFVRIGDFSQICQVHSDNETIVIVPKDMDAGYHEVYLELSFLIIGKVIKLSSNSSWILVMDDLSVELNKYLFQQSTRSFGSIKAAEAKVFDCNRMFGKPPKSQVKKRRKSRLSIKRKSFSLSSETGTDSDVVGEDTDDADDFLDDSELGEDNDNTSSSRLSTSLLSDEEDDEANDDDEKRLPEVCGRKELSNILDYSDDEEAKIGHTAIGSGAEETNGKNIELSSQELLNGPSQQGNLVFNTDSVTCDLGSLLVQAVDLRNKQADLFSLSLTSSGNVVNDLELLSQSFDHLSSSDLFSRLISDLTTSSEELEVMWSEESVICRTESLENLNSYYQGTIRDVCKSRNLCESGTINATLDYRSVSFKQSFMLERYSKQFNRFEEYSGVLNKKEFFSEMIPFFNKIGNSSMFYEEKEKEFQNMLDLERKSARGRRLQSNSTEKATLQVPKYQYLREITNNCFTEHELSSILQLYSNLRSKC
jgi:hypothetical protein